MENENYKVLSVTDSSCMEIILSKVTDTKIKVYNPQHDVFLPNPNEIQMYAEDHNTRLVFETMNLSVTKGIDVFNAVKWYVKQRFNNTDPLIKHFDN